MTTSAIGIDELQSAGLTSQEAHAILSSSPPLFSDEDRNQITANLTFLSTTYKPRQISALLRRQPQLLVATLEEWHLFLSGYGLSDEAVWKVLRYCPQLLGADRPQGPNSPYNAGSVIMFLKQYGWTDEDIAVRILPCYPEVLAATPEQLQASVDFLRSRKFGEDAIQRMVLTFPPLLVAPLREDLFPLIDRIRASAHNKYVVSGSYHV